jgi:competence protein ComEC
VTGYSIALLAGTLAALKSASPAVLGAMAIVIGLAYAGRAGLRGTSGGVLWLCVGWLLASYAANQYLQLRWPEAQSGERVLVEATVESIPTTQLLGASFDAKVRVLKPVRVCAHIEGGCTDYTLRARLLWRDRVRPVHAGERWQLLVNLKPPRARFNPGAVDMELHLFRERVHALGTVVESRLNRRIDAGHQPLNALRERIVRNIEGRVADRDAAALISALGVGATGEMSREQWRVFNATGTTHLVAISGLHVTLFALIALAISRQIWQIGLWRIVPISREPFAACMGLAASTAYAFLAGFSVPTQRTLIMLAVWLIARSSARACGPLTTLNAAMIAVLLLDPLAPLAAGFWLSFAAIAAIILVTHGRTDRAREAIRVQLGVSLALAPVSLAAFGSIGLTGLLVNVFAIPIFSFVLVPLVLLAILLMPAGETLSGLVLDATTWICINLWSPLVWASELPLALIYAQPPPWWYAAAALFITIALLPWPLRLRAACLLWLIPCAVSAPRAPAYGGLFLTMLDVGQGTAIVIRTSGHTFTYEAGDHTAEHTLIPYLRSQGIRVVDRASAQTWTWDGVRFELMARNSVMRVTTSRASILLTGDIDARTERYLVESGLAPVDVVVIPRRGSSTASSPELIAALRPSWALLSGNRRSGSKERPAIARWTASGAEVLATADSGAIHLHVDPVTGMASPSASRAIRHELWRGSP